jgi:LemA protein
MVDSPPAACYSLTALGAPFSAPDGWGGDRRAASMPPAARRAAAAALSRLKLKIKDKAMKRGCLFGVVVVGAIVVLALMVGSFFLGRYNQMVQKQENVNEAWSQVENQYQRRFDLIDNLVATVKGVANFEKETYTAVAEARAKAGQIQLGTGVINDPQAFQKFQAAQDALSSALSRLLVTVERYPELKANQNFLELQSQLEGTENRIAVERRRFNDVAREYNTYIRTIPNNFIAGIAGFTAKPYFEAAPGAEQAPKVKF